MRESVTARSEESREQAEHSLGVTRDLVKASNDRLNDRFTNYKLDISKQITDMKDTIEKKIFDSCGKLIIDTEKMKNYND